MNDTGPDADLDSSLGSVFWPLQPCKKRKVPDPVEVDRDSSHLGGFRGVKDSDKVPTVFGAYGYRFGFVGFIIFCFVS